jgi:16S rRNA processing protein RimM
VIDWNAMAVVGRIARAHGIRGQVIVDPETDFPGTRFQPGGEVFVQRGGVPAALRLTTVRFHRDRPVIGLEGVETMNDAEALRGQELRVPLDRLAPLPPGAFYDHDLVGCRVETRSGELVGTVAGVEAGADGGRLVVKGRGGEMLIPLAASICTTIDPAGKRIVIDPPDGLLELNE